jgi:hypothetical protein
LHLCCAFVYNLPFNLLDVPGRQYQLTDESMELSDPENHIQQFRIFDSGISADPLDEIVHLLQLIDPSTGIQLITAAHRDVADIFSGCYPG